MIFELIDLGEREKMAGYTTEEYLMDRANIHDLVTKMVHPPFSLLSSSPI